MSDQDKLKIALEAMQLIVGATDADNAQSYRADDREGCLDYVFETATVAFQKLKSE